MPVRALVGKTNLDQFACGLNGTRSPYGAVPNSFDARYVSGGSSSGSAYVVATGQVDFALGTDTAGSGRVPAGLNNIVGLKPSRGLISARGVVPAAQSVDCVSIFARTVGAGGARAAGGDGLRRRKTPTRADSRSRTQPLPARFRFGVPRALRLLRRRAVGSRLRARASRRCRRWAARRSRIDYAPLAEAAALLYDSALVAERYAAVRDFFDAHEDEVIEPVRGILARGRRLQRGRLRRRPHAAARRWRSAPRAMWDDIDVLLVPTAPTHYTHRRDAGRSGRAQPQPRRVHQLRQPARLRGDLGARAACAPDGLPFGITLIGPCGSDLQLAELGQRFHHATGLAQGATGEPLPAPDALPVHAPPQPRSRSRSSAPISRACR